MTISQSHHIKLVGFFIIGCLLWVGVSSAQDTLTIAPNETVSGTLTDDAPTARYEFEGQTGDRVTINLRSRDFDAFLRLETATGDELASNDDSRGSLDSEMAGIMLPEDGDYIIVVTSATGTGTGDYALTLTYNPILSIAYGDRIESEISISGIPAVYRFEGTEGEVISISLSSSDFDAYLTLGIRDGDLISDDDGGGGLNSLISGYILPNTGEYIITAQPLSRQGLGQFVLQLNRVEMMTIAYDSPLEVEIDDAILYYAFEGRAGDRINLRVESNGTIDTQVIIRAPDGSRIANDDDSGTGFDPEINGELLFINGTYLISITPYRPNATGTVTMQLELVEPEPLTCGTEEALTFDTKQPYMSFVADADAGDGYQFIILSDDETSTYITASAYVDGQWALSVSGDPTAETLILDVPIDDDASDVRILLTDYSYRYVTYTIQFVCP